MVSIASASADNSLFTQTSDWIKGCNDINQHLGDKEILSGIFSTLSADKSQSFQGNITSFEAISKWFNEFQFNQIVSQLIELPDFSECAARLAQLRTFDDLEENEKPLSLESAKGFLSFVCEFKDLGPPILGLFSQGTLSAGWRIADNKHLLIEPVGENNISFAIIKPDLTSPDQKFRVNGRGTCQTVIETLRKHDIDKWIESA